MPTQLSPQPFSVSVTDLPVIITVMYCIISIWGYLLTSMRENATILTQKSEDLWGKRRPLLGQLKWFAFRLFYSRPSALGYGKRSAGAAITAVVQCECAMHRAAILCGSIGLKSINSTS